MLTREQYEEVGRRARADPRPLIETAFQIVPKGLPGQRLIEPLVLNKAQRKVYDAEMRQREAGAPGRVIVLKARQPGISTYCSARLLATLVTRPYAGCLQIAHEENAAVKLFKKIKFMHARLPEDLRPGIISERRRTLTLGKLQLADGEVELGGEIMVGLAGGAEMWRSQTLHTVHLSELAQYQDAERVLTGVLPSVPKTPESLVVIESTAFGMGNTFHEEWIRAEAGDSDFLPVFIGWWEIEEYQMPVRPGTEFDDDELSIQRAYNLTDEQLQWRRYTIFNECLGSVDLFNQEYPATPADAFLASGMPVFPTRVLQEMHTKASAMPGPEVGEWLVAERKFVISGSRGRLKVWRRPQEGHEYAAALDPSQGAPDGDPACIQIIDRTMSEQVACWHGHEPPVILAHIGEGICGWYNAWFAIELNGGHGFAALEEIKLLQYHRLYVWTRVDRIRNTVTNFYGWETSFRTKPLLIDSMYFALSSREVMIRDVETIYEAQKFVRIDARRAAGIGHDDRIMALMIAWRVHLEMPMDGTGRPPRVQDDTPMKAEAPRPKTVAEAASMAVWDEVDKELKQASFGGRKPKWMDYDLPDPGDDLGPQEWPKDFPMW